MAAMRFASLRTRRSSCSADTYKQHMSREPTFAAMSPSMTQTNWTAMRCVPHTHRGGAHLQPTQLLEALPLELGHALPLRLLLSQPADNEAARKKCIS